MGACHDGHLHQLIPLQPVVWHGLCLCEGFAGLLQDVVSPHLLRSAALPLLRLHSTVPCSITLVGPSDLVTCPHHFVFCRFTVVRRFSYGPMCFMMVFRTKIPCRDSKEKRFTTTQELHTNYAAVSALKSPQQNIGKIENNQVDNICDPSGRNQSHVGRVRFPLRAEMHGRAHITDSCFIAFITSKIC